MFNWSQILWAAGIFLLTFVVSLALVGIVLVVVSPTFFLDRHAREFLAGHPTFVRWGGLALKNLLGLGLIVVGVALSLPGIPGQGLLTILIGVVLVDFPGKRRLERLIVGRPRIFRAINRWRALFAKPPLVLEE